MERAILDLHRSPPSFTVRVVTGDVDDLDFGNVPGRRAFRQGTLNAATTGRAKRSRVVQYKEVAAHLCR
jgi:hypothetical protein